MSSDIDHMVKQVREMFKDIPGAEVQVIKFRESWDGDDLLPPVGCKCEFKRAIEWAECTILYISDFLTVLETGSGAEICFDTQALQFRPICTEADRKREDATKAMNDEWRKVAGMAVGGALINIYDAIYDAIANGKIPHITLK